MIAERGHFALVVALVAIVNALWYWAKFILKRRGYPVSWLGSHFHDLSNLWRATCEEEDEYTRTNLRALLGAIIACLVGVVALIVWTHL